MIEVGLDVLLHLDQYLDQFIQQYGAATLVILSAVIFAETGLVVAPFLPGDSLLFAAGTLAARGSLDLPAVLVLLSAAAVVGNLVNYWIGSTIGTRLTGRTRLVRREHIDRAHRFFERYGGMTIVISRFLPILRTVAPFVAGISRMPYRRFLLFNVAGGVSWVVLFVLGGYVFGNLPFVRRNFALVIAAVIVVSLLPALIEVVRHRIPRRP